MVVSRQSTRHQGSGEHAVGEPLDLAAGMQERATDEAVPILLSKEL